MALSGSVSTTDYQGRYLKLTWSATQNIANNTSTISWTLKGAGSASSSWYKAGGFQVTIDGESEYNKDTDYRITLYNGTKVASGSITLKHGSDGKKSFTIKVKGGIYTYARNVSGSKSFTLDTIPRKATISSAPNFNDEGNPKITYSNLAGSAVTTLQACIANSTGSTVYCAYRDISKTGSSYTFNLTDSERTTLRNACKNAKSMTVRFYVRTVIAGTTYTSYLEKTLSITNANPTVSATVVDTDSAMIALTGSADTLVKYYSDAKYSISASGVKGASISSYKIECGTKSATTSSGTFSNVESGSFNITVTDSRGNVTTKTVTKTLVNYVKLTNNISYSDAAVDGSVKISWNGAYYNGSIGSTANTCTVQYRYKVEGGSYGSWVTATATKSGNTYSSNVTVTGLDYKKVYTFQTRVTDKITYKDSTEIRVAFKPIFDWGVNDFQFNVPVYLSNGSLVSTSDERVKDNITPYNSSDLFDKLEAVEFNFTRSRDDKVHFGLIAQQVLEAMNQLGMDSEKYDLVNVNDEGIYGIAYQNIIAMLIYEVQNLKSQLKNLKGE